jgi:DMSO/TMAO reductase YedYZ molybdopterin-dependent catalytic subunit
MTLAFVYPIGMINPRIPVLLPIVLLLVLCACGVKPVPAPPAATLLPSTKTPSPAPTASPAVAVDGTCQLEPVVVPTLPAVVPAPNQLDETTGLHMTGLVQQIDLASYRLNVTGKVDRPLSLSLDDLRCMPKVTASAALICYGVFKDSATWSGVPIPEVLERAGVQAGADTLEMVSADGLHATLPLEDALDRQNFLAYEMEGRPLPILHGFPLRAVLPNTPGGKWVKWLVELVVK